MLRQPTLGALLAPAALLLSAPLAAHAASTELDPITVTATGQPTAASQTLAAQTLITRRDIDRAQAQTLADLLRFYAGMEIGRNGGAGSTTSVFTRGGNSTHTLVLVDGVRVNPNTSGGAALQNITPSMIEQIEIIKGPRAALYGADAISGVINVITRQADRDGLSGEVNARGGSDKTWEGSARGTWREGNSQASLQVERLKTDGYQAFAGLDARAGYDRNSINARASTQIGSASIGAQLWDSRGTAEYYDTFTPALQSQDYRNQTLAVDLGLPLSAAWQLQTRASRTEDRIDQNQSADFAKSVRSTLAADAVFSHGIQRLTLGARFANEDVDALSFGSAFDEDRDILTLRAQDEVNWNRHHLVAGGSWADYDGFGSRWDGSLDYGFDVTPGARLIASVGTGFRAPDASSRFGFGGNPDLNPEKARNLELGWQQSLGSAQRVDIRVFQSDVRDLINVVCDASFNCLAENVDRSRNRGLEASYTLRSDAWSALLSGIIQNPQDRNARSQLLRRAKRSATLRINRDFGVWDAGVDVLTSAERPDFGTTLGGYTLVNATVAWRIAPKTELRLRGENLLDKRYETAAPYLQPRAQVYASIRQQF
ncbi:TonB-dependent receptor [Sinimarinibacterium sp. NLF-5-8]|uniref:TonB-dependent receptor domain-containing protein n=1 Tax=Sinimarinibacterium sp. NLF-5-8 TaxID=2698684 RepID=UPI00137C0D2B|nr:TonB-dependent receptor [Sinimarinibacterium sp. NLF-5-8]QHS11029.1 TonB-dependent receptor [Sinimarinibacterium sp. NLF-5-8]